MLHADSNVVCTDDPSACWCCLKRGSCSADLLVPNLHPHDWGEATSHGKAKVSKSAQAPGSSPTQLLSTQTVRLSSERKAQAAQ